MVTWLDAFETEGWFWIDELFSMTGSMMIIDGSCFTTLLITWVDGQSR